VGRDHTGVHDWYRDDQTRELFDSLDDLGITPIFFEPHGFNPDTNEYEPLSSPGTVAISGTQLREAVTNGDPLPEWYVREVVMTVLRDCMDEGGSVFWASQAEPAVPV